MKRPLLIPLLTGAGALACLLLSACGGGSTATPSPTPTPLPTPSLSASDLAGLVLPVNQITVDGTTLNLSAADSGPQTRAKELDGSFDVTRDSAELDQYGFKAGQLQAFLAPNNNGVGVFVAHDSIVLVDSPDHAAQAVLTGFNDIQSDVGKTSTDSAGNSATLDSVTPFTPAGINGGKAVVAKLDQAGTTFYLTVVTFSHGPVVVGVATGAYDNRDLSSATEDLARQADAQISTVVKS
jgi:hypothetical protein